MFCHVTSGWVMDTFFKLKSAVKPGSSPVLWKKKFRHVVPRWCRGAVVPWSPFFFSFFFPSGSTGSTGSMSTV